MLDLALMVIVLGTAVTAIVVDLTVVVGWLAAAVAAHRGARPQAQSIAALGPRTYFLFYDDRAAGVVGGCLGECIAWA